ncbi:hypothetical protein M0805_008084 [Coniferiporia weirii]|nr:hypothetical protein M0805_008084 [Coniferiporia weirii]
MDPSLPNTPQRGRSVYPAHLAKGDENRVPLHRRGKSKTYERLEDLLREAGFKETRVFTPEAERIERIETEAEERKKGGKNAVANGDRKGARATGLAGLLAGFVSWNGVDADTEREGRESIAQAKTHPQDGTVAERAANDADVSDPWEPDTPTPLRRPFVPAISTSDFSSPGSSSSTSSRSPPQFNAANHRGRARPPPDRDARTALRHMISAPDFLQRPQQLSHVRRVTDAASKHKRAQIRNAEPQPPMPANWLDMVAQAVMGTDPNSGAHIGVPPHHERGRARLVVPQTVKESAHEGDARRAISLARRGFTPHTPSVRTTPGIVTAASVVCRSAPGSRSSSLVRVPSSRTKGKGRRRDPASTCVPSLGVTAVEFEHGGWAATGPPSPVVHLDSETDDDSDDGEPDFARLLVPARRQHSIQSLRRHLHMHNATAASGTVSASESRTGAQARLRPSDMRTRSAMGSLRRKNSRTSAGGGENRSNSLDDEDVLEDTLARDFIRSRRGSVDEVGDGLAGWAAHGLPGLEGAVHKKRGTMPWTTWAQGR